MSASFREASIEDVEELHKLVVESTGSLTQLSVGRLKEDLFNVMPRTSVEIPMDDPEVEFDINQLQSNAPVARAVVAEVRGKLAGHFIFHYHFTPWVGHIGFVDDIFTRPDLRRTGIGRGLIKKAIEIAKAEGLKNFLFTVGRMSNEMQQYIEREGKSFWYRTDKTDWSVLQINFENNDSQGTGAFS